jgi:hypothetical protein
MIDQEFLQKQVIGLPLVGAINYLCSLYFFPHIERNDDDSYSCFEALEPRRARLTVDNGIVTSLLLG